MSNEPILKVRKLNLVFHLDVHGNSSWRDIFARLGKNPIDVLFPERDRLQVAKDISFDIRKGERVGLLGINGTGKTSLCRCIAGMYHPTSGKVDVNGRMRAIFNTHVGIQPELTGRENAHLLTSLLFPHISKGEARDLIHEALEFSELGKFADVPYRLYSNGMQSRLMLSLVSAQPTDLLILDEVFDGADTFFKAKIETRFLKTIQDSGAAIFVSHAFDQIRKVCTRVLVLKNAQIAFDGAPEEAIAYYSGSAPRAEYRPSLSP